MGPDWLRTEHTKDEFAAGFLRDFKAIVPKLSDIESLRMVATNAEGEEVHVELRTRMDGDVYYSDGYREFDVEAKAYKGSLAPFKTLVRVGGLSSQEAVEQAKKSIEELLK